MSKNSRTGLNKLNPKPSIPLFPNHHFTHSDPVHEIDELIFSDDRVLRPELSESYSSI